MKSGAAKIDITPKIGVWLDGIPRDKPSDSILSPLYARVVYITNGVIEIALIVCDLIGLIEKDVRNIKSAIFKETGLKEEQVVIASTHTHSGPSTLGILAKKEEEYIKQLPVKISKAVNEAKKKAVPCKIKVVYSYEPMISEYRRLMDKNGKIWMNWEEFNREDIIGPAGPYDPEVNVISIADFEDNIISVIFNHTGHPNTLTGFDYAITSDYPGEACRIIEEKLGGTALFFNGAQGSSDIPGYNDRNPQGIKKRGKILSESVFEALNNEEYTFTDKLGIVKAKVRIARREVTKEQIARAKDILKKPKPNDKSLRDGVDEDIYAEWLIKMVDEGKTSYLVPFGGIRIGSAYIFTVPGELFTEIGLKIKKYSPFNYTSIMGLADGYVGYIPTEKAINEGGYATRPGQESKLDKRADEVIIKTAVKIAEELL